jgi:DNA transposition AAA+ family ATPase
MTVRDRVLALLEKRPDISAPKLTSCTSLALHTVKDYIAGRHGGTAYVDRQLINAVDGIERGELLRVDQAEPVEITESAEPRRRIRTARDFYLIDTVRRIRQVLNFAHEHAVIGVITAEYGVGKTESVKHWRQNDGRKIDHLVFEFDEFSSHGVVDFTECLAERIGIDFRIGQCNAGRTLRAICAHLQEHPVLLIFDQAETVMPRIMQVIRQVWDQTRAQGVGVVFLASPLLRQRLEASRLRDLGALTSRVSIWAALTGVQQAEALTILKAEGVKDIDEGAFSVLYKATGGSMRRLMAVSNLLVTKHAGKQVTEKTMKQVAASLWGLNIQGIEDAA